MRNRVLLAFRPLHPAILRQCQLCGDRISEDQVERIEVRSADPDIRGCHYLFCQGCSPHLDRISAKLAHREAELDAAHEAAKATELRELAEMELEALDATRQHDPAGHSAPPSEERPSPRSRPGRAPQRNAHRIPNPKGNN